MVCRLRFQDLLSAVSCAVNGFEPSLMRFPVSVDILAFAFFLIFCPVCGFDHFRCGFMCGLRF